jgi:hypothetical protein
VGDSRLKRSVLAPATMVASALYNHNQCTLAKSVTHTFQNSSNFPVFAHKSSTLGKCRVLFPPRTPFRVLWKSALWYSWAQNDPAVPIYIYP